MGKGSSGQSITVPFCSFLPRLLPCSNMGPLHRLPSSMINLLQLELFSPRALVASGNSHLVVLSMGCRESARVPGKLVVFLFACHCQEHFLHFFECVFSEVPPGWLLGPAMPCGVLDTLWCCGFWSFLELCFAQGRPSFSTHRG